MPDTAKKEKVRWIENACGESVTGKKSEYDGNKIDKKVAFCIKISDGYNKDKNAGKDNVICLQI